MSNRNGYICVYKPEHSRADSTGMVYEHILKAEQYIGRKLKPEEVVHHEDRCRSNNSSENLMVFSTKSDHSRYHINGEKLLNSEKVYISPKPEPINCKYCNNKFEPSRSVNLYCSRYCFTSDSRKVERPTKEELFNKLIELHNFTNAGKFYGVSDNAVRKWCKYYDIPKDAKYYVSYKYPTN